jgi:hypothetical protein
MRLGAVLALFIGQQAFAQITPPAAKIKGLKGTFYISWGYNRETYSKRDIRFKNTTSDNYDFVLENAPAHDKPGFNEGFNKFVSRDLTVPQYNLHIGYLFNDKHNLGVELSWDHLKYVVYDNRTYHIKGQIRGHQIDKDTFVTPDFIHLQHTNGNNYLMLNLVKMHKLRQNKYIDLELIGKVGAGPLVSYSISTVLGDHNPGRFHVQGYVIGVTGGARINVFKYLFVQPSFQYAFADYLGTELGRDAKGRATHRFSSYTVMVEGGFNIPFGY